MQNSKVAFVIVLVLVSLTAAAQRLSSSPLESSSPVAPLANAGFNLPFQPIGVSDLIRITVLDAPELSQSFRVGREGSLDLPLLRTPIPARGLMPDALRDEIAAALRAQHLLVNPVVDVSVVEYRSRDVTISGAVKNPSTIQELGNLRVLSALAMAGGLLRVLSALAMAGGLLPEAGPEVIVEQPSGRVQRLSVRDLFDGRHPQLNIVILAGAQIRVPEGERVFVVGDVKRPGAFPFLNMEDTTVLQLLALSGGLDSFSRNKAYIYRLQPGSLEKQEIEVPLRRILNRKAADVRLAANDILYIPTNGKLKAGASVVNHVTGIGNTAVSAAIWSAH